MTRSRSPWPLAVNELRALLPLWAATVVAMAGTVVLRRRAYADIALIGYVAGAAAIGAHAIGHEYGHRTLPALLAQPIARGRLFITKLLVAVTLLATLAAAAAVVFAADGIRGNDAPPFVALPVLAGLFFAPLFTMICRNTLAGAVLGVSAPMTVWVLATLVAWWGFGTSGEAVTAGIFDHWGRIAIIVCPILAVLAWRQFNRLEAAEAAPAMLTLPWVRRAGASTRHRAPWRSLVAKEIRLQQLTLAITLFYSVIWLIGAGLRESLPLPVILPLEAVLLLYSVGVTIVIGALASAEERQQGTLESQLLQPVNAAAQWAVKCAVALSLSVLLGVVMPAVLIASFSDVSGAAASGLAWHLVLLVVLLTSGSLYLSSLASSGVKVMAWSVPVAVGAAAFFQISQAAIVSISERLGTPLPADHIEATLMAAPVLAALLVPALLWFAFVNHTSEEHPLRRTLAQAVVVAALVVAGVAASGALVGFRS